MASERPSSAPACDSCGSASGDVAQVRRVYLVDEGGRLVVSSTGDEVERWCPSCRSVYPHEPAAG